MKVRVVTALIIVDLGDKTLRTKKTTILKSNNPSLCWEINVKFLWTSQYIDLEPKI